MSPLASLSRASRKAARLSVYVLSVVVIKYNSIHALLCKSYRPSDKEPS
jgi:hypothetical protein